VKQFQCVKYPIKRALIIMSVAVSLNILRMLMFKTSNFSISSGLDQGFEIGANTFNSCTYSTNLSTCSIYLCVRRAISVRGAILSGLETYTSQWYVFNVVYPLMHKTSRFGLSNNPIERAPAGSSRDGSRVDSMRSLKPSVCWNGAYRELHDHQRKFWISSGTLDQ
jgi:hypothetical protein